MKYHVILALVMGLVIQCVTDDQDMDKGQIRLNRLRELSANNKIMLWGVNEFKQYALSYPRPYDIVVYFTSRDCKLCDELQIEYNYMNQLYYQQGAITADKNPTFFAKMIYTRENDPIFKMFGFLTIPNLLVSKPFMAVVSDVQKKIYYQKFKWAISTSDGHVTTHKMLQFTNQRTGKDIFYKPTVSTMMMTFFGFIGISVIGVLAYLKLKWIWNHWVVWFLGSILIYITCVSGVVYDIIHDVPFVGMDPKTGQAVIFAGANRQQYGAQGLIISMLLCAIGLMFVFIFAMPDKIPSATRNVLSICLLFLIFFFVNALQRAYKEKSWYGPSFTPPEGYAKGPIWKDQGNSL